MVRVQEIIGRKGSIRTKTLIKKLFSVYVVNIKKKSHFQFTKLSKRKDQPKKLFFEK